jgi:hypothetical protein
MQSTQEAHHDEEYTLPCAEALMAGTLALMTGHTQSINEEHLELMASKIASNLNALAATPLLSPEFKTLLWALSQRWQKMGHGAALSQSAAIERQLWHISPEAVQ